jgi:hypothetical protein
MCFFEWFQTLLDVSPKRAASGFNGAPVAIK